MLSNGVRNLMPHDKSARELNCVSNRPVVRHLRGEEPL